MNVDPIAAGMDEAQLERITEHFERSYLQPGKLAGCQVLVSRHGHVAYERNFGTLKVGGDRPITDDSIWRIYSMTKPITSVALDEPVRARPVQTHRSCVPLPARVA